MSTQPTASHLRLLADLAQCPPGMKVRFLGCVDEYVVKSATLRMKHDMPGTISSSTVDVSIEHLLETVERTEMETGVWLNVIGYIERGRSAGVFVQAVALWNAGNVDLKTYEAAVMLRRDAG